MALREILLSQSIYFKLTKIKAYLYIYKIYYMKIKVFLSNLLIFISKITTVVNHIGEVMVSIFALSVIDCEIDLQCIKSKTLKLVFVASPLSR